MYRMYREVFCKEMNSQNDRIENSENIRVSLFSEDGQYFSMSFVSFFDGKLFFESDLQEIKNKIYFVSSNGVCQIKVLSPLRLYDVGGNNLHSADLTNQLLLVVVLNGNKYVVFTELFQNKNATYCNYAIRRNSSIRIGRDSDCDIAYGLPYVGHVHAKLSYFDRWIIEDNSSANGTYVNGKKVSHAVLKTGDVVSIMGLTIIIGAGFIGIRVLDSVIVNSNNLTRLVMAKPEGEQQVLMSSEPYFNREPRKRKSMKTKEIIVDEPPMSMDGDNIPLLLRYGGSAISSVNSLLSGQFLSVVSSMIFPLFNNKYSEKQKKEYEDKRERLYTQYLIEKEKEIYSECHKEIEALEWNYPPVNQVIEFAFSKTRLWERKYIDDDFLSLRVGTGDMPMSATLNVPKDRFSMDIDKLEQKMLDLLEKPFILKNVAIRISLIDDYVIGVSGDFDFRVKMISNLLLQLCFTHSYDEVKVIILGDLDKYEGLEALKYIPHVWNDSKTFRFLATNSSEAFEISEFLHKEFEKDISSPNSLNKILGIRPYYVLVALDKKCFDSVEVLKDILHIEQNIGFSIVAAFDDLPKECTTIIRMNNDTKHEVINLRDLECANLHFELDNCSRDKADKAVRMLNSISLASVETANTFPKSISFLEMYGVGMIENLNIFKKWSDNNPVVSLAAPIGVNTDGSLFYLDLHEKNHGPHGLVAGMTGSGKSEFIMSYVLSMAVNYHPDEVAFILIDYKGGGLAGAFDDPSKGIHLPHILGTITNLDGSTINRSLRSVQSELLRRQSVFNKAKSDNDEGTMDIYRYQKLYRNGKVSEPMPHLFIVSDEFAELKAQQPDFMEQLISTARIGRSLGVHLILATQKPGGVVNGQILSNTKFRVCLKVQDKSDSVEMLGRPEAAELVDTGRFYLQVGYNEQFSLGQSAWSGATYIPREHVVVNKDNSINFIDNNGYVQHIAKFSNVKKTEGKSQLVEIVKYLSDYAKEKGINPPPLWKPLLPDVIQFNELMELSDKDKKNFVINLGMVDDPEKLEQYPLSVDFMNEGHLLIAGDSGSGKTTLIQTLLLSGSVNYSIEDFNYYIFDFSNKLYRSFEKDIHCGAWVDGEDAQSVHVLVKMLVSLIQERKQILVDENVSNFEVLRKTKKIPLILVVIDDAPKMVEDNALSDVYFALPNLLRDCHSLGIRFVMSTTRLASLATKIKQEMSQRIAFSLPDKYDYADFLGSKGFYVPADKKGRGLICDEGRLLEFQAGVISEDKTGFVDLAVISKLIERIGKENTSTYKVKRMNKVEEGIKYSEFCQLFEKKRIPIGYALGNAKPVAIPLKQLSGLSVYFGKNSNPSIVLENLLMSFKAEGMEISFVKSLSDSILGNFKTIGIDQVIECDIDNVYSLIDTLSKIMVDRRSIEREYCVENGLDSTDSKIYKTVFDEMNSRFEPKVYIFENIWDFYKLLNNDAGKVSIFKRLCELGRELNIFFCGCFYGKDYSEYSKSGINEIFNTEKISLLFGKDLEKNPYGGFTGSDNNKEYQYNQLVMLYHNQLHPMIMPCGEIEEAVATITDDEDIFE